MNFLFPIYQIRLLSKFALSQNSPSLRVRPLSEFALSSLPFLFLLFTVLYYFLSFLFFLALSFSFLFLPSLSLSFLLAVSLLFARLRRTHGMRLGRRLCAWQ